MIKVSDLKKALKDALKVLEDGDEEFLADVKLRLESNTYFVNDARFFLGVSGRDGGYLNIEPEALGSALLTALEEEREKAEEQPDVCPRCGNEISRGRDCGQGEYWTDFVCKNPLCSYSRRAFDDDGECKNDGGRPAFIAGEGWKILPRNWAEQQEALEEEYRQQEKQKEAV